MDWSYVSGYFDGEGNVHFKAHPGRPDYIMIGLSWANTHLESLEAIRDFIECGSILGKRKASATEHYKTGYQLNIGRLEDILRVGEAMIPHLIVKRDQMDAMLNWARENRKSAPQTWGILTDVGKDELSRLYHEEGMTQRQIAERFGVTDGAVSTFFVRNGINGRRTGPKEGAYGILAQHGHEKLMAMFESGMTMNQIAKELGVQAKTVYMHFYTRGIRLTKRVRKERVQRNGKG